MARIIMMTDFSEAYPRRLLIGVAKYAHDFGQAWTICRLNTTVRDKYGIDAIVDYAKRFQADVVIGQFYENDNVSAFTEAGIIPIAQEFSKMNSSIRNITGEHKKAGKIGADYFINKGFHNFAFLGMQDVGWSDERLEGFRQTILKAENSYTYSEFKLPHSTIWSNYDMSELSVWIKSLPKPVAIMACDDNQAFLLVEVCRNMSINENAERLRIPDDVSVLGVDNDESICCLSYPNLSSINQEVEKAGYELASYIDHILKNPDAPVRDIVVPIGNVISRQSSDIFVNDDPSIAKVLRYIHENISTKISVNDIVAEVPLSRRLLESRFKKEMGTSIYDYIIRIRIEKIAELLSEGKTVSEAAFELGLTDIKNVSRSFKRLMGSTPSEYREKKHGYDIASGGLDEDIS